MFSVANIDGINVYTLDLNKYINQPLHNNFAHYEVELQFEGNSSDYSVNKDGNNINYFKRSFEVTIDRLKPDFNLSKIVDLDNLKFSANSNNEIDKTKYFYPLTEGFDFISDENSGYEHDSFEIFVRPIISQSYPTNYYYTITPDSDHYSESNIYPNNPRFSESEDDYSNKYTYILGDDIRSINAGLIFNRLVQIHGTHYYEVIERDEAGNYTVYAVQYYSSYISPDIRIDSQLFGKTNETQSLDSDNLNITVKANLLTITDIFSYDLFLKVKVQYGQNIMYISNNPELNRGDNNFVDFISKIESALSFTQIGNPQGYTLAITFINRFHENYTINYLVPGEKQNPIFIVSENKQPLQ